MENINIGIAFIAGLFSFLSPCVLPLVPGYISFISGVDLEEFKERDDCRRVILHSGIKSIFFVFGFSLVFILLGASATVAGKFLEAYRPVLSKIAGVVIVFLGLHLIGLLKLKFLYFHKKIDVKRSSPGIFTAFFVGLAFAFGWSPCIGPILAGILAVASQQDTMMKGIILLSVYSLGLGIPFILSGFLIGYFMHFFNKYKRFIRIGEIVSGGILVLVGVLIFSNNLSMLLGYVPEFFYEFLK